MQGSFRLYVLVGVVLEMLFTSPTLSANETRLTSAPANLSQRHLDALNRRRRVVVNYDIHIAQDQVFGMDVDKWVAFRFAYADQPGSQIDSMWFCLDGGNVVHYPSKILEMTESKRFKIWTDAGVDILNVAVKAAHKRGLEAFYSHRMNGSDRHPDGTPRRIPLKDAHPNWLLDGVWWEPGFWNYAVPEVRAHKLAVLRELAENYDLDGLDLDFARTPPFLPIGAQWEHRDFLTGFVRQVRAMTQEVAAKRGRPLLLSMRTAATPQGCHYDGIDIETWAREQLVDIIMLGTHSIEVDLAEFRRIIDGTNIKLYPCMDDAAHAPDGYRWPGIEVERGIFANWWHQGADGVATFNWANASNAACAAVGARQTGPETHGVAYLEIGSSSSLRHRDKTFVVPRRYGGGWNIPWLLYTNINFEAPLPKPLPGGETPVPLQIYVADDLARFADRIATLELRVLLTGAAKDDDVEVKLNGALLTNLRVSADGWRTFFPRPRQFVHGRNLLYLRVPRAKSMAMIEKLEVSVRYR